MNDMQQLTTANMNEIQQLVERAIDERAREDIVHILDSISLLKPQERLLLYMRMPSGAPDSDPLRQPQNPLGTRSEINHTINWVRSHLEHDPNVSIPKQDVYDDYFSYCNRIHIKPLSTADFGKVMKQVFPDIRPRRLGTRGNSRYCYAALRKTTRLTAPQLALDIRKQQPHHDMSPPTSVPAVTGGDQSTDGSQQHAHIVRQWAASVLDMEFSTTRELADYIAANQLHNKFATTATTTTATPSGTTRLARAMLPKATAATAAVATATSASGMKPPPPSTLSTPVGSGIRPASAQTDNASPSGAKKRRRKRRNSHASGDTSPAAGTAAANNSSSRNCVPSSPASTPASSDSSPRNAMTSNGDAGIELLVIKREPNTGGGAQQQNAYNYSLNNAAGSRTELPPPSPAALHVYKTEQLSDIEADTVSALSPVSGGAAVNSPMSMTDDDDPIQPHPLCKKVRQAQQTKGLLSMRQFAVNNHAQQQQQHLGQSRTAVPADTLMRPPDYSPPARSQQQQTQQSSEHSGAVARRLALLQQYRASNGVGGEKEDDVTTDIIIPRERVISICSLDKDALDDYLNGGDNSQDQEVELLRYFQTDETCGGGTANNTVPMEMSTSSSVSSAPNAMRQQVPVLENYHLSSESTSTTPSNVTATKRPANAGYDKNISELRWYLQQNLQSQLPIDATQMAGNTTATTTATALGQSKRNDIGVGGNGNNNRHSIQVKRDLDLNSTAPAQSNIQLQHSGHQYSNTNDMGTKFAQSSQATMNNTDIQANASSSSSSYTQSPTSVRRRNYSFVPISPGPESPLSSASVSSSSATPAAPHTFFTGATAPVHSSTSTSAPPVQQHHHHPFLSPQSTLHRRTHQQQQQQHLNQQPQFKPNHTIPGGEYTQPHHTSASSTLSAPTSPSSLLLVRQQQQLFGSGLSNQRSASDQHNHNHATFHTQLRPLELTNSSASAAVHSPASSAHNPMLSSFANRSQSAPLHRHMSGSQLQHHNNNKSFGSSLTDTPIDFCDFGVAVTEPSQSLSLSSISDQQHDVLIKCEPMVGGASDVDMTLASSPLLQHHQQQQRQQSHLIHQFAQRDSTAMSVSRSVPSTPQPSLFGSQMHLVGRGSSSSSSTVATPFGGGGSISMYADMSKSVPTTPTGLSRAAAMMSDTPFRYSPLELINRDFLINGNTVAEPTSRQLMLSDAFFDTTSCQSVHQQRTPTGENDSDSKHADAAADAVEEAERRLATAIGDINDELSAFGDETGATDPIVGSDLLHTL